MSDFIWYLIIGVGFNFIFDIAVTYVGGENRLNVGERILVTFIWPIALITFIYHFIKVYTNGPD